MSLPAYPAFAFLFSAPEAAHLPMAMLLVFGVAKLMAELFERFGQPGIAGEIIAGILIGPSVFNWVAPNELLTALAELGVMFLLFRVGLEVKASELMRVGGTAALVAVAGVIVPFFLGWGILLLWGYGQIEAVFMGAAMVATSVGITAQVLSAKGVLSHRASQIILGAAVIDDVLGLLVLAMVSGIARGRVNVFGLVTTAVVAVLFTVIAATWGTRTMKRLVPHAQKLRIMEAEFTIALVVLFALSLLAVYTGVAAIIGAFLAGMALAEGVGHRVHDLAHGVTELLVPFFLVGIGLHFSLAAFSSASTIILALVILIAAVIAKFVGCGAGAVRLGVRDAVRVGVGMVPRGEVGMVVAGLGLSMGVISQPVYGVAVFMCVLTTVVAPPLLNLAYRDLATLERAKTAEESFRLG